MRLRRLVKFLIFCWAAVVIGGMNSNSADIMRKVYVEAKPFITEAELYVGNKIFPYYTSKWESKLPDVRIEYNIRPAFASLILVCISLFTSIFLQAYHGNAPARAPPEPRGPL